MKKSTLITTIAMIVVVVVALSTATYAWFTNGTATQVTDTISTTAASGWYLYGATFGAPSEVEGQEGERTVTYSATSDLELHLLNAGLFSPNAALSSSFNTNGTMTGTYKDTMFFSAEQVGFGVVSEATVKTAPSYTHVIPESNPQQTASNLNAIRIVNNNEDAQHCHLTILVSVGTSPATTAYVAGKKFRTYIVKDAESGNVFNTEYYYGTAGAVNAAATIGNNGATIAASTGANAPTYSTDAQGKTIINGTQPTSGYSIAATGNKFGDTVMANEEKYYTLDFDLGSVEPYEAINIVFYAWFDGWALDNTAAGADIKIVYSVNGTATAVATPSV